MTTKLHDAMTITLPANASPLQNTPTTGQTIALTPAQPHSDVILLHAATIAALTLTVSAGILDGQTLSIFFKSAVTTATWSTAVATWSSAALPLPGAITAGQRVSWVWAAASTAWIRLA